jgi:hypothetical protein
MPLGGAQGVMSFTQIADWSATGRGRLEKGGPLVKIDQIGRGVDWANSAECAAAPPDETVTSDRGSVGSSPNTLTDYDTPSSSDLALDTGKITFNLSFDDYLMYEPTLSNSAKKTIWVTLGIQSWAWSATAERLNGRWSVSNVDFNPMGTETAYIPTATLPTWNNSVFNLFKCGIPH